MNQPDTYECSASKLKWQIAVPMIIFGMFMLTLTTGMGAWIIYVLQKSDATTKFDSCVIQGVVIFDLIQVGILIMLMRWNLNITARMLRIKDDELLIETCLREVHISWDDIAVVGQLYHMTGRLAFVKTYEAQVIGIGPQLKVTDELMDAIKSRAKFTITSDPALAWERRLRLWRNEFWRMILRPIVVVVATGVLAFSGYLLWESHQDPALNVAGRNDLSKEPRSLRPGKERWIQTFLVTNNGRDFRDMKIELSGDLLKSHSLKNPKILIVAEDKLSSFRNPYVAINPHRELIQLKPQAGNVWSAVSTSVPIKYQTNLWLQTVQSLSYPFRKEDAQSPVQHFEVQLFADVTHFKGKRHLHLALIPPKYSHAAKTHDGVYISAEESEYGREPLPLVALPKNFPVTPFANSTLSVVESDTAHLYAEAQVDDVLGFLSKQLTSKGWSVAEEKTDGFRGQRMVVARKSHWKFRIEALPEGKGTQYNLTLMWV